MRRNRSITALFVGSLLVMSSLMFIDCRHEYPPFDEYQVISFTPIDSVNYGRLFVERRLFTLHDTTHHHQWSIEHKYDLSDPTELVLLSAEGIDPIDPHRYITYQDSLVFLQPSPIILHILNLRTGNSYFLDVSYYVLDVELSGDYLFVNQGHDGFQVWDISNLPDYVVVFNDSVYRYWGCMASRDSLLLEIYRDNGYTYKFWNIADPAQPYVITEGSLPHQAYYNLHDIAMTEQYVIGFSSAVLYRYRYDPTGSLTYEDVLSLEYAYYDDYRTSDSLIYLLYPHRVDIISIDDFMLQQPITVNHMNYYGNYALAIEVFEEYVYLMLRDKGIRIYQRRVR